MKCPSCKKLNSEGVKFCKYCGSPLIGSYSTCPNGHNYESNLTRCPFCPSTEYEKTMMDTSDSSNSPKSGGRIGDKTIIDNSSPILKTSDKSSERPDKTVIFKPNRLDVSENNSAQIIAGRKLVGWLVTFDINTLGSDYRLFEGRAKIGRSPNNDIIVNQQGISDEHAILLHRDNKFYIQDNLSTNGTFVNGVSIDDKLVLKNDDIITLGNISFKLKVI